MGYLAAMELGELGGLGEFGELGEWGELSKWGEWGDEVWAAEPSWAKRD